MKKGLPWLVFSKSTTNTPRSPLMSQVETSPKDLIVSLQSVLYKPCRRYFETILFGSLLTVGCVTSWILAGSQDKQYRKVYKFIARIGKQVDKLQHRVLRWLLEFSRLFPIELPIELVIDDSPIKRYGRKVEGAGRMYDPTNPHCRNATCYGHSLVMVGMIARRPAIRKNLSSHRLEVLRQREQIGNN